MTFETIPDQNRRDLILKIERRGLVGQSATAAKPQTAPDDAACR